MNRFAASLVALSLFAGAPSPTRAQAGQPQEHEIEQAAGAFAATRAASERDGGRLWGQPLYGPILLIDPASRRILANQADAEGKLRAEGPIYAGQYPADQPIANTAVDWAGVHWATILLPLPEDLTRQVELIEHELFHRLQTSLGLPMASYTVAHLDGLEGRTLLRLEWRALRAAIEGPEAGRRVAIADALVFRARRRALFPAGAEQERALEMNEGLAEDTGCSIAARTPTERQALALTFLASGERRPSFARSFAYASGPAYGLLLDQKSPGWRKGLDAKSDLGLLLSQAIGFAVPGELEREATARAARYDGSSLRAEEQERERLRLERAAASRQRFVMGPVLILALVQPQVSFDPNYLEPFEGGGTVYRTLELTESWGTLRVIGGGGALITNDWKQLTLPAPSDRKARPLTGDGWTLTLNPDWSLEPAARTGDWKVVAGGPHPLSPSPAVR